MTRSLWAATACSKRVLVRARAREDIEALPVVNSHIAATLLEAVLLGRGR